MEPAHAAGKDFFPIKVSGFQQRRRLVRAVVENHRSTHAVTAVAIDGGNVWPADPIVFEAFIEWIDPHRPYALGNQFADWVINHRRGYPGLQAEAVRQIRSDVVFAAADMNLTFGRFAKGNDARIEAMDDRTQR